MLSYARMLIFGLIIAVATSWSTGALAQVTLYEHCNFEGYAVRVPVGATNMGGLTARGARNDDISAVRVSPGYVVEIYEHAGFSGRSLRLTASDGCLVNDRFNDIISSVRVSRIQSDGPPAVALHEHCDFAGRVTELPPGRFDLAELQRRGMRNDDVSAISVARGYIATIFEHAGFQGRALQFSESDGCLVNDQFNDILSSIRIERAAPATPPAASDDLSQGIWQILVAATGRMLHVDGLGDRLVSTRYQPDDEYTEFRFVPQDDGSYRIRVMATGRFLHADGLGDQIISTRYQVFDDYTRFYVERVAADRYRIVIKATGRAWHVDGTNDQLLSTRYQPGDAYAEFYLNRVR